MQVVRNLKFGMTFDEAAAVLSGQGLPWTTLLGGWGNFYAVTWLKDNCSLSMYYVNRNPEISQNEGHVGNLESATLESNNIVVLKIPLAPR